jgi:hypothetical protein
MIQPVVTNYDPMRILSLPFGAVAMVPGDLASYESAAIVLVDAAGENITFMGICGGKRNATGDHVPIYTKCIVDIDLTSAAYTIGQGLVYTSKNTLVDHGSADTIAWFWDLPATVARGKVIVDIFAMNAVAANIVEIPLA